MDANIKFNKRVDVVSARSEGDKDSPLLRVNYYSRDGKLSTVPGIERAVDNLLSAKCTAMWRYYSQEEGVPSPRTIAYTVDGKLWHIDEYDRKATIVKENLNLDAYPKACQYKLGEQYHLYIVDGEYMWKFGGRDSWYFTDVTPKQSDGTSYKPIDIIEHLDRIVLLTERQVLISKNLDPTVFDDATDSLEIILGSGRGINKQMAKIDDRLYFFTTEGVFVLTGDYISAVASTFSIDLVDSSVKLSEGRSGAVSEKAFVYLGDDRELYSFNGQSKELLSYNEQVKDWTTTEATFLKKSVAHYDSVDKRYFLSVVENGETENNFEIVYDAIENKIDFIQGRNVSTYCQSDSTREPHTLWVANSKNNAILFANRGKNFDGVGIRRRLRTRDLYFNKGNRGRITAFYPEIIPYGNKDITMRYLLDGSLSDARKDNFEIGFKDAPGSSYATLNAANDGAGNIFTAPATCTIDSLFVYINGPSGSDYYSVRLYGVTAGVPSETAITTSTSYAFGAAGAKWVRVYFNGRVQMTAGNQYIVSVHFDSGTSIRAYYNGGSVGYSYDDSAAVGSKWTAQATRQYCIYAYPNQEPTFSQNLQGQVRELGLIQITNQGQFIDRVQPKINLSMGSSIAFEIDEAQENLSYTLIGMGIDVTQKPKIKGKKVGI